MEQVFLAWKKDTVEYVAYQKRWLLARIHGIQRAIYEGRAGHHHKLEDKLQTELSTILQQEELMWFQRSRSKWLTDGDCNTKYYHLKAINRRRQNRIVML